MNALLRKEVRLLLPIWLAALGVIFLPAALSPVVVIPNVTLFLVGGAVLAFVLALGAFGREFAHGTFSLLLALPVSRHRLWWIKVGVLATALVALYGAWWLSFALCAWRWPALWTLATDMVLTPLSTGLFVLAVFSGGLWTTVFLRQVAAAIWFALLLPLLLATGASAITDRFTAESRPHEIVLTAVILGYAVAGLWLARWLFLRAEDAHWTGGTISLPAWTVWSANRAGHTRRCRRPLAALLHKEYCLHRPMLLMAALLLVMHVVILAIRRYSGDFAKLPLVEIIVATFWGLWLLLPFLLSAAAVAEERKLGLLEGQLCQPIGWRRQWWVKLFVTATLGVVCGTIPPCLLEDPAGLPNFFSHQSWNPALQESGHWMTLASTSGIAFLVGIHASSLARNTFQALASGVGLLVLGGLFFSLLEYPEGVLRKGLWRGNLGLLLGWPTIVLVLLSLARGNFRRPLVTRREWARNICIIAGTAGGLIAATTAIYHRAWELFQETDPPHGPARLTRASPVRLRHDGQLAALGPNGELRIYEHRFHRRSVYPVRNFAISTESWERHSRGSNWVSFSSDYWDTAAVRADGTLWVSRLPRPGLVRSSDPPVPAAPLIQVGTESDWRQIVRDPNGVRSRLLLKSDGTLWHWRVTNTTPEALKIPFNLARPVPVGVSSNWVAIHASGPRVYLTRADETVWVATRSRRSHSPSGLLGEWTLDLARGNDIRWRNVSGSFTYDLGVKEDGTLWAFGQLPWSRRADTEQLDARTSWRDVAGNYQAAVALQTDGSLWRLEFGDWRRPPTVHRVGRQTTWLTIASSNDSVFAVAADGDIWCWGTHAFRPGWFEIAPSRRPIRVGNILD